MFCTSSYMVRKKSRELKYLLLPHQSHAVIIDISSERRRRMERERETVHGRTIISMILQVHWHLICDTAGFVYHRNDRSPYWTDWNTLNTSIVIIQVCIFIVNHANIAWFSVKCTQNTCLKTFIMCLHIKMPYRGARWRNYAVIQRDRISYFGLHALLTLWKILCFQTETASALPYQLLSGRLGLNQRVSAP